MCAVYRRWIDDDGDKPEVSGIGTVESLDCAIKQCPIDSDDVSICLISLSDIFVIDRQRTGHAEWSYGLLHGCQLFSLVLI